VYAAVTTAMAMAGVKSMEAARIAITSFPFAVLISA
jgi:hypothetical protein